MRSNGPPANKKVAMVAVGGAVATERGPVSALGCNGAQNPCMGPRSQQRLMFAIFLGRSPRGGFN
jgi:hypothetical protein